jgi:predicted DCC family thiol-disulfide oxidoreductase YuxK
MTDGSFRAADSSPVATAGADSVSSTTLASTPVSVAAAEGPVILYDGLCGLCDRYVQFVLRYDQRRRFRFAPLQGAFAARALARHGMLPSGPSLDSVVLVEEAGLPTERLRVRSDAVLAIVEELGGAWRLTTFLRVIPRPLRDAVYRLIARMRHRLFGRLDACAVPADPAAAGRFLA